MFLRTPLKSERLETVRKAMSSAVVFWRKLNRSFEFNPSLAVAQAVVQDPTTRAVRPYMLRVLSDHALVEFDGLVIAMGPPISNRQVDLALLVIRRELQGAESSLNGKLVFTGQSAQPTLTTEEGSRVRVETDGQISFLDGMLQFAQFFQDVGQCAMCWRILRVQFDGLLQIEPGLPKASSLRVEEPTRHVRVWILRVLRDGLLEISQRFVVVACSNVDCSSLLQQQSGIGFARQCNVDLCEGLQVPFLVTERFRE